MTRPRRQGTQAPRFGRYRRRALLIEPHRADMQERDGGGAMLQVSRSLFPYIRLAELRRFGS